MPNALCQTRLEGTVLQQSSVILQLVRNWQNNGRETVPSCPNCLTPTLRIEDQSVRPHAEWYYVCCSECGLDETLHLPMRQPMASLD